VSLLSSERRRHWTLWVAGVQVMELGGALAASDAVATLRTDQSGQTAAPAVNHRMTQATVAESLEVAVATLVAALAAAGGQRVRAGEGRG